MTAEIIPYVQMIFTTGLAYGFYMLLLKRNPVLHFNRIAIIISVLLGFLVFIPHNANSVISGISIDIPIIQTELLSSSQVFFKFDIYKIIYIIPTIFFLLLFIFRLVQIAQLVKRSEKAILDGVKIYITDQDHNAFSFCQMIFVGRSYVNDADVKVLIFHEMAHKQLWHSLDTLFFQVLTVFFWFNPFLWLFRKEIIEVQELQADRYVVNKGVSRIFYQQQLLKHAMEASSFAFGQSFSKLLIKTRIKALNKTQIKKRLVMKYLFSLPLLFVLIQVAINPVGMASNDTISEKVYQEVDTQPQYKDGDNALFSDIANQMNYPQTAKNAGKTGTVYVKFIINKDGKLIDADVKRGFHKDCDAEALRVINNLKDWTAGTKDGKPVNVEMVIPIKFQLK
jgi:TonB family protein